ncbi:MAG: nuclease [Hymenobacter sp.]|nr:MAG: nuclease [Hymenobacter sp.]
MSIQSNLEQAANGLVMMSESEYPFEYISTEDTTLSPAVALKLGGKPEGTPVTTTTLDHLLRNLTDPASGTVSPAQANQYQQMAVALKSNLAELTVYRVGEVQVDALILGLTPEGTVAGIRTKLIET